VSFAAAGPRVEGGSELLPGVVLCWTQGARGQFLGEEGSRERGGKEKVRFYLNFYKFFANWGVL